MKAPECVRDGFDIQHSILSLLGPELRKSLIEMLPIDHPIDHHMADMDTCWSHLSGQARRHSTAAGLGRGKRREGRPRTQRGCGARIEDASAALGDAFKLSASCGDCCIGESTFIGLASSTSFIGLSCSAST